MVSENLLMGIKIVISVKNCNFGEYVNVRGSLYTQVAIS